MNESGLSIVSKNAAANSHAICARITIAVEIIELHWHELIIKLRSKNNSLIDNGLERLWIERLNEASDSSFAKSVASKEFNRPIHRSELGLRTTLVVYADKLADLIVVGDQGLFNKASLIEIVQQLVKSASVEKLNFSSMPTPLKSSDFNFSQSLRPSEAVDLAIDAIELNGKTNIDEMLAITGRVLSSYELLEDSRISLVRPESPKTNQSSGESSTLDVLLPIDEHVSLDTLIESVSAALLKAENESKGSEFNKEEKKQNVSLTWNDTESFSICGVISWQYLPCMGPVSPITLIATPHVGNGLSLHIIFNRRSFAPKLINRLLSSINKIFIDVKRNPKIKVLHAQLLTESECHNVVGLGRNDKQVERPFRVEDRISVLAQQQPNKVAIRYENNEISYLQLNEQANQISHALLEKGVIRGDHIGICIARSIETVVAMLGILKSGAVYVPIDPNYPAERIAYTCADAKLKFVISEMADIPEVPEENILHSECFFENCRLFSTESPYVGGVSVNDAAYIIYTSGSTGKPKGVVIPHCNLSHLINATTDDFQLNSNDIWSLFHSTAFDFSVWEIWGCLLTGGLLVVVPYWTSRSVDEFASLLKKNKVTVLNQTPSAFVSLIQEDESNPLGNNLRLVIFGGEALDAKALLPWFDRHPETECRLVNMFGITETTVHVTAKNITRHDAVTGSRSVGKPLPGWLLYVLDEKQQILPPGVSGEVFVGGAGVALHYHGKPELTAERFVPDSFNQGKMYKSGDKGMMLENGELLHLGRLDDQIKLRGFRIELGEIRNTLLSLEGVITTAVTFTQTDATDSASARLDAYLMLDGITVDDVIHYVKRTLPVHMQPTSYQRVSEMPLTPNGKLDTKRLAEVIISEKGAPHPLAAFKLPAGMQKSRETPQVSNTHNTDLNEGSLDQKLIAIWQEVLQQPISLDDNFFDLGGNSLYAIRISTAMIKHGLPALHMRELYLHQTISNIANVLREEYSIV